MGETAKILSPEKRVLMPDLDAIRSLDLDLLKKAQPEARVLVHPEAPADVIALADAVGSTLAILNAAQRMEATEFIVATESGMLHKLRAVNPRNTFIEAPTAGNSATCKNCVNCPWMAMSGLAGLAHVLESGAGEVQVDPTLGRRARLPIDRMLAFTAARRGGQPVEHLVADMGAA